MKPSVYKQLDAVQIDPKSPHMKPSPRHWNPGLLRYKGRLWMSVRYHLGREHASRCAVCMVPLDKTTLQPTAPSQHLNLPALVGDEHFEDARLFMFNGAPHISYTQMTGYKPGVNYTCTMRYARLKLNGNRWIIDEVFWPKYGANNGLGKEKNWAFFEHAGALHAVYQDHPSRKIIRIDGERIVDEYESEPASWPWGVVRGGSPPIPFGEGKMLAIFHSSIATEEPPHFVRYYGAAYVFEAKPPFRLLAVSAKPIMAGSEADGHGFDPRYAEGWKPWVVFPCGLVPDGDNWLTSIGVNDWQCAVGKITPQQLNLISPDRSDAPIRYFTTPNGTLPAKLVSPEGHATYLQWEIPSPNMRGMAPTGYFATVDGREAEALESTPRCEEITEQQYRAAGGRMSVQQNRIALPVFG
jgi:predicted GH43/DUF377 family glycosyl hydrolase